MNRNQQQSPKTSTLTIFLMCVAVFGVPAGACIYKGDLVTGIALAVVGLCCYFGYHIGASKSIAGLAGLVLAFYLAPNSLAPIESQLTDWFSISGLLNRIISFGVLALIAIIACNAISWLISKLLLSNTNLFGKLNRWGGLLLFGAKSAIVILLFLCAVLMIYPDQELGEAPGSANFSENAHYHLSDLANRTRAGLIGDYLAEQNPFKKFPQLNKIKEVQYAVGAFTNPAQIDRVINHPRVEELQSNPAVQQAVAELKTDQTVQNIIQSGQPLDAGKVFELLNSASVLNLLEQPEFLEVAAEIANE